MSFTSVVAEDGVFYLPADWSPFAMRNKLKILITNGQ